mgnify:CR=1 FL=1
MSEKLINFLETYKFKILPNKPIKYLVKEFKPSVFMAAHSNVLIESSLYNAIPVLLKTNADYSFDLIREKSFLKKYEGKINLILTSPPFALNNQKSYGCLFARQPFSH